MCGNEKKGPGHIWPQTSCQYRTLSDLLHFRRSPSYSACRIITKIGCVNTSIVASASDLYGIRARDLSERASGRAEAENEGNLENVHGEHNHRQNRALHD